MHRIIKVTAAAATIAIAVGAGSAAQAYTIDAAGKGFVGKGEVQTVLGYNNKALQDAVLAKSLVFTAVQPTTQSLFQVLTQAGTQAGTQSGEQSGTQAATQAGTQAVSQDLTCTFTNGNATKVFHRDGLRDGERDGVREGSRIGTREGSRDGERAGIRTGSQAGIQSGRIAYDLDVDARKANQYTGFILKNWLGLPAYAPVGDPVLTTSFGEWTDSDFGAYEFGAYDFAGVDYDFAEWTESNFAEWADSDFEAVTGTEWGEWDALPGENPDDCLRSQNADHITQISNVVTPGLITDGDIEDGAITDGGIEDGAIEDGAIEDGDIDYSAPVESGLPTADGTTKVFVNGKAL